MQFGRYLMFFALVFIFFSCKSLVRNYNDKVYRKYQKLGFESHLLESDGHSIYYFDNHKEELPTLVLVHGFGGDGKITWKPQVKEFSKDYRIIVMDLLWFGKSSSSHSPSLASQVDALKTLVEKTQIQKFHLAGISYGGFLVLDFALQQQHKLKSLIIIDSPGPAINLEEIDVFCQSIGVKDVKEAFVPKTGEEVKRLFEFSFYKAPKIPNSMWSEIQKHYFNIYHKEQELLLDELPENKSTITNLKRLKIPVHIMWGEEDEIFLVHNAYKLQDSIPNSGLTIFPKAGHALPVEDHKRFNKDLKEFLEKVDKN